MLQYREIRWKADVFLCIIMRLKKLNQDDMGEKMEGVIEAQSGMPQ